MMARKTLNFFAFLILAFTAENSMASDHKHPIATGVFVCKVNSDTMFDELEESFREVHNGEKVRIFNVNLDTGEISGDITSDRYLTAVKNNGELGSFIAQYSSNGMYRGDRFVSNINILKISTWLEYPDESSIALSLFKEAKKTLLPPSKKMSFRLLWKDVFMVGTCSRQLPL